MKMTEQDMIQMLAQLLGVDSPIGYTGRMAEKLVQILEQMGYTPKILASGGVYCELNLDAPADAKKILLTAHMDTLGAMVAKIKENGRLQLTPLGGLNANNVETENCKIYTRKKKVFEGTIQLANPSIHVNGSYNDTKRDFESVEVVLDLDVKTKEDVLQYGIQAGDIVAVQPRFQVTESGYIKSRFLDDKAGAVVLLALAKELQQTKIAANAALLFSAKEEMGFGGAVIATLQPDEILAVDMGCVGDGLDGSETKVSICAKDSGGPYDYEMVSRLLELAEELQLDHAVDVYPHYGSDAEAAMKAGCDSKHALIGPGVFASHGYERTHKKGILNTYQLLEAYVSKRM